MLRPFFILISMRRRSYISGTSEWSMKEFIYWGSYLYFPFVLLCALAAWRGSRLWKVLALCAVVPASLLAYARFVEPQRLNLVETEIDLSGEKNGVLLRAAVFADMHYGVFGNSISMRRIVRAVNAQDVDVVFIPGDFVYHLPESEFEQTFAPLTELDAPVFAVLGNHDVGYPGPDVGVSLTQVLERAGVTLVENKVVSAEIAGQTINIAGASDLWQNAMSFEYANDLGDVPVIFLAHNPDTAYAVPDRINYDLMVSGHTHGGQIRVPGMLRRVIPTKHPFDHGLHRVKLGEKQHKIFVTPGTGMVGLPMRFRMLPRIDILNLQIPEG